MAGKRAHEIQAYSNCSVGLRQNWLSYGKALSNQGVHSVYIGKTHVYTDGSNLGFSEMRYPLDTEEPGDVYNRRRPLQIRNGADIRADDFGPIEAPSPRWKSDMKCIDVAEKWLRESSVSIDSQWTLTVNVKNPHFPHHCEKELWDLYADNEDLPPHGIEEDSAKHPYASDLRKHFITEGFTPSQVRGLRRGYYGCISFVDRELGRLIRVLEETGQIEETNVIYASDHGEMLGKFGMWWKCSLYDDSVRIPIIAMGPHFKARKIINTPVDLLDLNAFLFKASGTKLPEGWYSP
jgi:choline-sulfatase